MTERVLAVIPARLLSTRLPRKMLRPLLGKPLLQWTVEAAQRCTRLNRIVVATDSEEIAELCSREGWDWQMTSPLLQSGTDRMHAVAQAEDSDIYVNLQGDEPLLRQEHVDALLRPFALGAHVDVTTVSTPCRPADVTDPNVVKVVSAADGRALYFSRSHIPFDRDGVCTTHWRHLGLYAYRRAALQRFAALPQGALEQVERLEQLRLLENGMTLYVEPVELPPGVPDTVGVDTEEDLRRVEELLRRNEGQ